MKKMLQEGEKEEIRISVSLLKNISRYRELHADIGELPLHTNIQHMAVFSGKKLMNISTVKQVLPELVAILPNSDRSVEQPIEVTVSVCHILINLSHVSVSNTSAIINQGALPKIISISSKDNGYGFIFRYVIKLAIKVMYVHLDDLFNLIFN